jgi:hypothetical protein
MKVAMALGRQAVGYELDLGLLETIKAKPAIPIAHDGKEPDVEIVVRSDARHLRGQ